MSANVPRWGVPAARSRDVDRGLEHAAIVATTTTASSSDRPVVTVPIDRTPPPCHFGARSSSALLLLTPIRGGAMGHARIHSDSDARLPLPLMSGTMWSSSAVTPLRSTA
jgi:hypothetical protein